MNIKQIKKEFEDNIEYPINRLNQLGLGGDLFRQGLMENVWPWIEKALSKSYQLSKKSERKEIIKEFKKAMVGYQEMPNGNTYLIEVSKEFLDKL